MKVGLGLGIFLWVVVFFVLFMGIIGVIFVFVGVFVEIVIFYCFFIGVLLMVLYLFVSG